MTKCSRRLHFSSCLPVSISGRNVVSWVVMPCGLVCGNQPEQRRHVPPKRQKPPTKLHGVTTKKTMIHIFKAMRTSNLIHMRNNNGISDTMTSVRPDFRTKATGCSKTQILDKCNLLPLFLFQLSRIIRNFFIGQERIFIIESYIRNRSTKLSVRNLNRNSFSNGLRFILNTLYYKWL
jgi:hypothetical protein